MSKLGKTSKMIFFLSIAAFLLIAVCFLLWTKYFVISNSISPDKNTTASSTESIEETLEPFPIGVNTIDKKINEDPLVESYLKQNLSIDTEKTRQNRFINRLLAQITKLSWYQNLASSVSRMLVIYPGERREEIVQDFGDILDWEPDERELFSSYITKTEPALVEGKFFPGRYVVESEATPETVADLLLGHFNQEVLSRYSDEIEKQVPLEDALVIASLLEREAYDFNDMRYISGIIWNRLFVDMPLQLDASLQYARGSKPTEKLWWPKVVPADKYINSPYNTYKNAGLPPTPIANPSVEAIVAALNPRVTDCMFYFHDQEGKFYCTKTYPEHVKKLKEIYGRGK